MKLSKAPKILISRGDVLGDVVVTTALIKPIKKAYPDSQIYFLVKKVYHPILADIPEITGLIEDPFPYQWSAKSIPDLFKLAKKIRSKKFDVFIGLWEVSRYGLLALLAGIPIRIGHRFSLSNSLLYSHKVALNYQDFMVHKMTYNLSLLGPLGIQNIHEPRIYLAQTRSVNDALKSRYPQLNQQYTVVHVGAGNPQRVLLAHQFRQLLHFLKLQNIPVVLLGLSKDEPLGSSILDDQSLESSDLNLVGQLSLEETKHVIANANLVFSSDSAPVHIAAGYQVPVIIYYLNRIQNACHWGAWGTGQQIIKSRHDCIDQCQPSVCRKLDCKDPFDIQLSFPYIKAIYEGKTPLPNLKEQQYHWAQTSITIGQLGTVSASLLSYFDQHGWSWVSLPEKQTISQLSSWIEINNINVIVMGTQWRSLWARFKVFVARYIASNRITFLPKLTHCESAFEWEAQVAHWLRNETISMDLEE
ncbi:MAG: hypothetical protein CL521_00935 [Actinobacteria bacterium]|nr:hypothetical protein [Actinomycetota bacterium]